MATNESDPYGEALSLLSDAENAIGGIESDYAPVFAGMAAELARLIEADRDGQIDEAAGMLDQLRAAWESQETETEE